MSRDLATTRPRLQVVEGAKDVAQFATTPRFEPATPQIVIVPVEQAKPNQVGEFAFELARALAAQTARAGAIVIAEPQAIPRLRPGGLVRARPKHSVFARLRLEPVIEREVVGFFDPGAARQVVEAVRDQMPQVVIASDASSNSDSECGATGYVLLAPSHARFEYIELLRGELTALRKRPVLLAQLNVTGRGGAASRRSQAWELAAELVMSN